MIVEEQTIEISTPYSSGSNIIEIKIRDEYDPLTNQSTLTVLGARWRSTVLRGVYSSIDGNVRIGNEVAASFADRASWTSSVISDSYPDTYMEPESATSIVKTHDSTGALTIEISLVRRINNYSSFVLILGTSPYTYLGLTEDVVELTLTTRPRGIVYIANGSTWDAYQCYIGNGDSWDLVIPYIGDGTSWAQY